MADRTDIDALLISALYGELTPADEARLTAHLESHPTDRTTLADLTHTRATVRASRILAVQFEPPQSVSALLLQEAARRAPKRERAIAGWFHRFTRSFMMHPAMAAAAMLVLVVGVAGTMYVRHGDQFAETSAPAVASSSAQVKAPDSTAEPAERARGLAESDVPAGGGGSAAGSGGYRVALAEPAAQPTPGPRDDQPAAAARVKGVKTLLAADSEGNAAKKPTRGGEPASAFAQPAMPTTSVPKPAKKAAGIELRSRELEPKDFDDDKLANVTKLAKQDAAKRETGNADGGRARVVVADNVRQAPGAATSGGGGATALPSMMPQQNHAAAPAPAAEPAAPDAIAPLGSAIVSSNAPSNGPKAKAPTKSASRSPQGAAPSLQPPPPPAAVAGAPSIPRDNRRLADKPVSGAVDAKRAEQKTAEGQALTEWAQKQREQVLAFVRANNCGAAANAAIAIYNRAPDYYAANVATDRSIKPCIAYVNREREREDRSRAAMKRANAADTPVQAAPPPARK